MKFKAIMGTVTYGLKKYSPEILLGVGLSGVCVSAVMACKATLRCEEVLDDYRDMVSEIDNAADLSSRGTVTYSVEDERKDRLAAKGILVLNFVKLYGPSVTLMGASMGCILGAHRIMSKRNVALMAAYKVLEESFTKYREQVVKELGERADPAFKYAMEDTGETRKVKNEDGTEKEIEQYNVATSGFARWFEPQKPDQYGSWTGSTQWSPVHDYNRLFLNGKEELFNAKLVSRGFVTVNDVYDELGFPATEAGMICGWRYKSDRGDGYISFLPHGIDGNWTFGKDGDPILLDFNIDGVIFDQNDARKEMK